MKINKLTIALAALSFSLLTSSCEKQLTLNPTGAISDGVSIVDASTARAAIIGAYSGLQDVYAHHYPTLGTMPADLVEFNGSLTEYLQLDQNSIPTDNVKTVSAYKALYKTINIANSVIAKIATVSDAALSTTERNTILGEAHFLRGLAYFDLGRGWGGVQLQLKPTENFDAIKGIKRSSLAETYAQVHKDLLEAERLLPEDNSTRNRAQKSVVRALKSRLFLYQENWAEAENYATQVINNTKYSLVESYSSFFAAPFLTTESVFELTFASNDRNTYWVYWYPSSLGGQWNIKPTNKVVTALLDPAQGGDRKALIKQLGNEYYGVLYNSISSSTDPAYLIRIAELYLIRAEARAQQGKLAAAAEDLNKIRNRSKVASYTLSSKAENAKGELLLAIENENALEFPFEAHRWFDLVRTKRAGAVLGLTNTNYWLFPLPFTDIQSDKDDVEQNPGY
ncbi:RagB/SusD family nutrient uptake outer membrane protein [Sphingobacteriaceae bacterium WQ 2009]|uniref:RagB/SusD family nutrient uptake outer membrane protein n=1 Tax=Rhinopithecimicrobium faecis TaxID=2820698 RepID=A0A8T4HBL7_9SPHI|nr:RagB/SusD family nutrient uptake outer membrane protein [Sphingobacteriaceae bacterium WQ 2009]